MIAQVILTDPKHIINQVFDYAAPDNMDIKLGMKVIVPFGIYNNSAEALVVGIKEKSDFEKLKPIKKIADTEPVCTPELIELIFMMQKKYLCSFYSAYKLIAPPKTGVRIREWISLSREYLKSIEADNGEGSSTAPRLSKAQSELVKVLAENDGLMEYAELVEKTGSKSLRRSLASLKEKGVVSIDEDIQGGISSLKVRKAELSIKTDDAYVLADELLSRRATALAGILLTLCECGRMTTADLIEQSGANYSALSNLVSKGYVTVKTEPKSREAFDASKYKQTGAYEPTEEQAPIIDRLNRLIENNIHKKILLRGVTGSGKTEVFLQAIENCIKNGKQAIMLVPEISLTPQMVERFVSRFGAKVAVIHSALSVGERYDQWNKIRRGEVGVVVGARSAVFAPFDNIGIIILDEEHENSYKSEMSPRYSAHEIAGWRAEKHNAPLLLASATPSVVSYYKAETGEYELYEMHKRYNLGALPKAYIVDMRKEIFDYHNLSPISGRLEFELRNTIDRKEKSILFLNRRGYSTFVSCRECGYVVECKDCSIPMTYHRNTDTLTCHYCGYTIPNLKKCPECGSKYIKYFGTGTQKIEAELNRLFPEAKVIRMDHDTTSKKGGHEAVLNEFKEGGADILLGTQMVTKGLDFPDVTLVGVLAADSSLGVDDFRANERSFSLITQVCGRAGRGDKPGIAIIQTYQPGNLTINFAKDHNYIDFYQNEIKFRRAFTYPPFSDIICITTQGKVESETRSKIESINAFIKKASKGDKNIIKIVPPAPAPIFKIKQNFRYRLLIKAGNADKALGYLTYINDTYGGGEPSVIIDVNPINMS